MNALDCERHLDQLEGVALRASEGRAGSPDMVLLTAAVIALVEDRVPRDDSTSDAPEKPKAAAKKAAKKKTRGR